MCEDLLYVLIQHNYELKNIDIDLFINSSFYVACELNILNYALAFNFYTAYGKIQLHLIW